MPFSERMGHRPSRSALQVDSIDDRLRTALFNLLHRITAGRWYDKQGYDDVGKARGRVLWTEYWRQRVDTFSDSALKFGNHLHEYVRYCDWFELYDLIEFCLATCGLNGAEVNRVLERDMAGYRVREGIVVPVTDEVELSAIDEALGATDPFGGARTHIVEAITKLSLRPEPDLRNAITEAVSAVESAARVVSGKHKATLGDALKALDKSGHVHPALRDAWLKLYGYTSDEQGLRHAMLEDPEIDFATAKYMVVSCAAFVNLLVASGLPSV